MSSAFKTLLTSDFAVIPYIASKDVELTNCQFTGSGIEVLKGVNIPQTVTGSLPEEALVYNSVRNLYYNTAITSSIGTGSLYEGYYQSTAAVGTWQQDIRTFPTQSGAVIKVLSIPTAVYGEAITPKTIQLYNTTQSFYLVDDGNGNIIDLEACVKSIYGSSARASTYIGADLYSTDLLQQCLQNNYNVGNVLYPHGIVVITDEDYLCVADAGATTDNVTEIFLTTETPKVIQPLLTATADCSPIDINTLKITPIEGEQFPDYTIAGGQIILNDLDPLTETEGVYRARYTVKSEACAESTPALLTVYLLDCQVVGGGIVIQSTPTPTPSNTPTATNTPTPTPTPTVTKTTPVIVTPTSTRTPTPTQTLTPTPTITRTVTPTATPSSTPINGVSFTVCAYINPAASDTILYRVFTAGDGNGNAVNTTVTISFRLRYNTAFDGFKEITLTATVPVGTYTSALNFSVVPEQVTALYYIYNTTVTPSISGTQTYSVSPAGYLNDSTCGQSPCIIPPEMAYHASSPTLSCVNYTSATYVLRRLNGSNLSLSSGIYTNNSCSSFAPAGYYTDVTGIYYWNGSSLSFHSACTA